MEGTHIGQRSLADYLTIIRRRRWLALIPVILVPLAAFAYAYQQPKVYAASAEVLLSRDDLGSSLTGITSADAFTDSDRFAATQASLARVPEVARRALERANVTRMSAGELLAGSSVRPRANADLLRFTVEAGDPELAATLATAYAEAFSSYRVELDTASLASARADLQRTLGALAAEGARDTPLYRDLREKAQELRTLELLQTKPRVVRAPDDGSQVAPSPRRNAMLGLGLGVLLGLAAAFLVEALDRRVRDESELERVLGLPLLARLPAPRRVAGQDRLAMIDGASEAESEAVRRLRSNVELANLDVKAKVIMVTSAVSGEGKSVTIANLAIALARSGRRVVLADLDLRKPAIAGLLGTGYRSGLTDVAIGRVSLDRALFPVQLDAREPISLTRRGRAMRDQEAALAAGPDAPGTLHVLPAGFLPANPGELVGTSAVGEIIVELRRRADFVLVDAPPLLAVSDALTLSTRVDAILVVVRFGLVDRPTLRELARQLDVSPAHKLGIALAGAEASGAYGYEGYRPYAVPPSGRSGEARGDAELPADDPFATGVEQRESPSRRA